MTDLEQEAAWRNEFEADRERAVLDTICHGPGIYPDPKRSFALPVLASDDATRRVIPSQAFICGSAGEKRRAYRSNKSSRTRDPMASWTCVRTG